MADIGDFESTFPKENGLFRTACADTLRIVSILSLDSSDVTKPPSKKSASTSFYEKCVFLGRFFYMVFIKGFTPTVFDILPFTVWKILTIAIYVYRLIVLPFWLRVIGYGKYASWEGLGTKQPDPKADESQVAKPLNLSKNGRLSETDFGDEKYEYFLTKLFGLTTHLSPHSQSPGNPFTHVGFPGNFFDHLTGVYKILLAWKQPKYIVRGGLFHSLYGTYDYRFSMFDLRKGRGELQSIIGPFSEELAFALCTSDRIGLITDLYNDIYGKNATVQAADRIAGAVDGNPLPKRIGELSSQGYPVRNHITQAVHVLPPQFFASFIMVTIADFMEQGAIPLASTDLDVCLFQFLRYRFYNDLIMFVRPYLRHVPPVWLKYMGDQDFVEPTRQQILLLCALWKELLNNWQARGSSSSTPFQIRALTEEEESTIKYLLVYCPYLAEPHLVMGATLKKGQVLLVNGKKQTRTSLAAAGRTRLEEWGMLTIKSAGVHGMKEILHIADHLEE